MEEHQSGCHEGQSVRFWNGFGWFKKEMADCCEHCSGAQHFINVGEFLGQRSGFRLLKHCSVVVVNDYSVNMEGCAT